MAELPPGVLFPPPSLVETFYQKWKESPDCINPPAFNHVKAALRKHHICNVLEAVRSKSGLGTFFALTNGKFVTIRRRYAICFRSTAELIKKFNLPSCVILAMFTNDPTCNQVFSSNILFVGCVYAVNQGGTLRISKMSPFSYIDLQTGDIHTDRGEVEECFCRFQKVGKSTTSHKEKRGRPRFLRQRQVPCLVANTEPPCGFVVANSSASCGDDSSCHEIREPQEDEQQKDVEVKQNEEQKQTEVVVVVPIPEEQTPEDDGGDVDESSPEEEINPVYVTPFGEEFPWTGYLPGDESFLPDPNDSAFGMDDDDASPF